MDIAVERYEVMIPHLNTHSTFYNEISGPELLIKKCVFLNQSTEHFIFRSRIVVITVDFEQTGKPTALGVCSENIARIFQPA